MDVILFIIKMALRRKYDRKRPSKHRVSSYIRKGTKVRSHDRGL